MTSGMIVASLLAAVYAQQTPSTPDGVLYGRTYKVGEKAVYNVSQRLEGIEATVTLDVELTVGKVLENGRAVIRSHMSDKHETGTTSPAPLPPDVILQTASHNMPERFSPTMGSIDYLDLMLFLAGSTMDRPVQNGNEEKWSWSGGPMTFDGASKVIDISPAQKELTALIKGKFRYQDHDVADISFKSRYSLVDGSLIESDGKFVTVGIVSTQDFKFVKK